MTLRPLEEAPFGEYLKVLRENGHEDDAKVSEQLYVELLTIPFEDGTRYTREQIMALPFKVVHEVAEKIVQATYREVSASLAPPSFGGKMMAGEDAAKLSPEALSQLARAQIQAVEDEKERMRLSFG